MQMSTQIRDMAEHSTGFCAILHHVLYTSLIPGALHVGDNDFEQVKRHRLSEPADSMSSPIHVVKKYSYGSSSSGLSHLDHR